MKIYVKKIDGVSLPSQAMVKDKDGSLVKSDAAGYDIVATSDPKIVGDGMKVPVSDGKEVMAWKRVDYVEYETNLFIAPEAKTFHTLIHPRSSVSKYNLILANSIGLVDNDYRGMVICRFKYIWQPEDYRPKMGDKNDICELSLYGWLNESKIYKKGDTIAQLVVEPTTSVTWEFVDDLTQTQRGEGGFGSTDRKEPFAENTLKSAKTVMKTFHPKSMTELYQKAGGVPVKRKYSEEIKEREEKQ